MTGIPGDDYFDFDGNGWFGDANRRWSENHKVNPETGELEGDYPLPPADVARGYQAMHDRAVWNYRRRLMNQAQGRLRDGSNYQKGAAGLLQSYRAGGSAALEAGIYNNVAGGMRAEAGGLFQQADMTQPLDLLGDLRRHDETISARRADRANERSNIASIVSSLGQYSAQAGAQAQGLASGGGGGGGGASGMGLEYSPQEGGDGGGSQSSSQQMQASMLEEEPLASPLQGGPQPSQDQQMQQQGSPFAGASAGGTGGQTTKSIMHPFGGGAGGSGAPGALGAGQGGIGQGQAASGEMQAPSPMAGSLGAPGADGNFSPESFAAASASAQTGSPLGAMSRIDLNHFIADLYENDPFYQAFPTMIDHAWRQRFIGTGAA